MTHQRIPAADRTARNGGASLIEVLIAFVVLALGITSIVSFQGTLAQHSDLSKARTEASNLGTAKLEELRNYRTLAAFDSITSGSDTVTGANHTYTRAWTVTTTSTQKTIVLQVTWPDKGGSVTNGTTVTLNTVLARLDPTQTVLAVNTTSTTTGSTTSTTTATTTTTTAARTTTTSAATTTTAAATTTTAAGTTTTAAATTMTTAAATSTTTVSTAGATTTTTAAPVACSCRRSNETETYRLHGSNAAGCSDDCCMDYTPKCTGRNCDFTAFCPAN